MANLYGKPWTKDELRARVGEVGQLAGIERVVLDDGPARGLRAAILRTGAGLEAEVLLDRGMDLGRVHCAGMPLGYRAPSGEVHPSYYDAQGLGWLRTFGGGLLVTCGLQNVGSPCEDEGQAHGLHGGISTTPAAEISQIGTWRGDDYIFGLSGKMREVTERGLFGPNLTLTRTISGRLGANRLSITDVVENEGHQDSHLLILYHINVGFPIVDEGARLLCASRSVEPRDDAAKPGLAAHDRFEPPRPGYREQAFFHEMVPNAGGRVRLVLASPARPGLGRVGLGLEYGAAELPRFIEWKMMGAGAYVVGLEPANALVLGRADERRRETLQTLRPGERRTFSLELAVLDEAEIRSFETDLDALKSEKKNPSRRTTRRMPR